VFDSSSAFATHRYFGFLLQLLPFILIVTAFLGGFGRLQLIAAVVMFLQFFLQSFLLLARESAPAIAALHPVNGFVILLIALWLARDAGRRWQHPADDVATAAATESATG
jgi:hypothetical protein